MCLVQLPNYHNYIHVMQVHMHAGMLIQTLAHKHNNSLSCALYIWVLVGTDANQCGALVFVTLLLS